MQPEVSSKLPASGAQTPASKLRGGRGHRGRLGGRSSNEDSSDGNLVGYASSGPDESEEAPTWLGDSSECDVIVLSGAAEGYAETGDWHLVGDSGLVMLKAGTCKGKGGQGGRGHAQSSSEPRRSRTTCCSHCCAHIACVRRFWSCHS